VTGSGSVAAMSSQEPTDGDGGSRAAAPVSRPLAVVSALVLVVGLVVLAVFGFRYWQARQAHEVATDRETVSEVAAQVIINAFSFDHRTVDDSLGQLREVSTGDFLAEQDQWAEDVRTRVVEQKAVTTATVSHTAVETLDRDAGSAAVLVVFTAHSEREGQDPITGRQAMRVDLTREGEDWKANAVDQVGVTVPVGESSGSVRELTGPDAAAGGGDSGQAGQRGQTDQKDQTSDETTTPAPRGGR
jgi:Mce-associated membrane protein